jgi:hypothetical protein
MPGRIFLYPYAGPGGRNHVKQKGTLDDIARLELSLKEGLILSFHFTATTQMTQASPTTSILRGLLILIGNKIAGTWSLRKPAIGKRLGGTLEK